MSLSRNILKLLSGRIAIQFINFLTIPIVTRLFLPQHFGIVQTFDSLSLILIALSCLKYDLSIPLARNKQEALASLLLSSLITLTLTGGLTLIVALGGHAIAAWLHTPELRIFLWFLPFVVLSGGVGNALNQWIACQNRFGALVWADLGQSFPERLVQILWGVFINSSVTGLFAARLIGLTIRFGILFSLLGRKLYREFQEVTISPATLAAVAKRHKKFPLFTSWSIFFNKISAQVIPLFFSTYFSSTVVGYYSLGYRIVRFPITTLSNSIQKVFFPAAAREYRQQGTLEQIVRQLFLRLLQIGIFPIAVICFLGPTLFQFVYGPQWYSAGVYAQITALWILFSFLNAPLKVFLILNRQGTSFLLNALSTLGTLLALAVGVMFPSPLVALALAVGVNVMCILGKLCWQLKLADVPLKWASAVFVRYVSIVCVLLLPVKFLAWSGQSLWSILGALTLSTAGYLGIVWQQDPSIRQRVPHLAGKKFPINFSK